MPKTRQRAVEVARASLMLPCCEHSITSDVKLGKREEEGERNAHELQEPSRKELVRLGLPYAKHKAEGEGNGQGNVQLIHLIAQHTHGQRQVITCRRTFSPQSVKEQGNRHAVRASGGRAERRGRHHVSNDEKKRGNDSRYDRRFAPSPYACRTTFILPVQHAPKSPAASPPAPMMIPYTKLPTLAY
eukprot:768464-Hanusia_phi.AAC.9